MIRGKKSEGEMPVPTDPSQYGHYGLTSSKAYSECLAAYPLALLFKLGNSSLLLPVMA